MIDTLRLEGGWYRFTINGKWSGVSLLTPEQAAELRAAVAENKHQIGALSLVYVGDSESPDPDLLGAQRVPFVSMLNRARNQGGGP